MPHFVEDGVERRAAYAQHDGADHPLAGVEHPVRVEHARRAGDRAEVVIPPVDPLARFAVIGGPAEIGGVDVGGEAFLEPVHLVGADKVHLARQRGAVTRAAQVVGIGRDVRGELCRVVIDAGARGQLARHEAGAARRTQGRAGVGIGKAHRARGEGLEIGRVQPLGGAVGKQGAVQLIDHQDQDIRAGGHRHVLSGGARGCDVIPPPSRETPAPSSPKATLHRLS
ncbi:hypothetical protein GALL_452420 [mine drainage metagenome]|uniref:Uncharacterized protein n=1 Tax=mine drainage metagenome TaxID=410659 RepID=A0A1J5Q6P9_9ZZZZ